MTPTPILAALDIGTNSVLALAVRSGADGCPVEIEEHSRTTRLGEDTDRTGALAPAAMSRTLDAATAFIRALREHFPTGSGIGVATSAVRDARNGTLFLDRCTAEFGFTPQLLSGVEEARTTFRGAASDRPPGVFVVALDIGGGSTEIGAGFADNCLAASSLNLGCVRFGERFGLYEIPDTEAVAAARCAAAQLLQPACRQIRQCCGAATTAQVLVSGGTGTTFAALMQRLKSHDRQRVHGFTASEQAVTECMHELLKMPSAARARLPGISVGRAPVLPAGLLVLSEALRQLQADAVTVTTRGLRFGLALRLHAGELQPSWHW